MAKEDASQPDSCAATDGAYGDQGEEVSAHA